MRRGAEAVVSCHTSPIPDPVSAKTARTGTLYSVSAGRSRRNALA